MTETRNCSESQPFVNHTEYLPNNFFCTSKERQVDIFIVILIGITAPTE